MKLFFNSYKIAGGFVPGLLFFMNGLSAYAEPVSLEKVLLSYSSYEVPEVYLKSEPGICTTTDPSGGNQDGYNFLEQRGRDVVLCRVKGPGVITRIYSAIKGGRIKIYLDGEVKPSFVFKSRDFFAGGIEPFEAPLVQGTETGNYSYVPILFSGSMEFVIETIEPEGEKGDFGWGGFWQISYLKFPPETEVQSFRLPLREEERGAFERLKQSLSELEKSELLAGSLKEEKTIELLPFSKALIFNKDRAGTIYMIQFKKNSGELDGIVFRAFWDNEQAPSIEVPLNWLLVHPVNGEFGTLFTKSDNSGGAIKFFIPYSSCRIELENFSDNPIISTYKICYQQVDNPGELRLHSYYNNATPLDFKNDKSYIGTYKVLDAKGEGYYFGTILGVYNRYYIWWGEGDESFIVDEKILLKGTGTEDYFNSAWCEFGRGLFGGALVSKTVNKGYAGMNLLYRWHFFDPLPFKKSISLNFERLGKADLRPDNYYFSVALWYQKEPHLASRALENYTDWVVSETKLEKEIKKNLWQNLPYSHQILWSVIRFGSLIVIAVFVLTIIKLFRKK